MSICDELEELIPAYALDALDTADRVRVEKHLRDCPGARDELVAYQNLAAQLSAAAEPIAPRRDLKYRVLASVAPKPSARLAPIRSTGFMRPAFAAFAAVVLIGLISWNISLQNQLTQQIAADRQLAAEITSQRDLFTLVANADPAPKRLQGTTTTWGSSGRLYGSANDTSMAVIFSNMPALAPDKVYQMWLTDVRDVRISGGTFTVDNTGNGWLIIRAPQALSQYRSGGVTLEPPGGSPQPTGTRIVSASFTP